MPPQRYRSDGAPGPAEGRAPYQSGDMPLLTHEETGAASVARGVEAETTARVAGVALAERPEPRRSRHNPAGKKAGKGGSDGKPPTLWRRMRKWVFITLGLLVMGPFAAFVIGWVLIPVPTSDQAALAQVARFTFADGTTELATLRPTGAENERINRERVTIDQIPLHVREAVLAAEDRSFYSNPGFDFMGIGRAVFNQLTGGVGGGSTITQQYVKVSTGQDQFSLWRKYREVVLAVKISREQTKDEILENYLNTIYLGRGAYGIQAAAKAYFGKPVQELTVSEGAMLAGIIQSPSNWDPAKNPDRSQARWNFVLDGMVQQGWLNASDRAQQTFPTNWLKTAPATTGVPGDDRYHIYERAMAELASRGITEQQINTEGLTITTTIDQPRQKEAVDAINKVLKGQPANLRSALVSVDPRSGAILAYYGGSEGLGLDYAGEAERQPGSSFKPFVLAAAMEQDPSIGLGSTYDGTSGQVFVPGGDPVDNSEGFDCARCSVKTAMTRSINTIFYRLGLDAGPRTVAAVAHKAGIPDNLLTDPSGGIALGDKEVHPADMASAFATFAADGVRHDPYIVSKVVAADGRVLYQHENSPGEQTIPQQVARNVTEAMLDVAKTANVGLDGGRPVAAKTGTVQKDRNGSDNKDAWMVGFTPSISTAVWIGTDTSEAIRDSRNRPIYGRMLPGQIWQEFMNNALEGSPEEQFSKFVPLGTPPIVEGQTSTGSTQPSGAPQTTAPPAASDNNDGNGNGNSNGNGSNDGSDSGGSSDDDSGIDLFPGQGGGNGDNDNGGSSGGGNGGDDGGGNGGSNDSGGGRNGGNGSGRDGSGDSSGSSSG